MDGVKRVVTERQSLCISDDEEQRPGILPLWAAFHIDSDDFAYLRAEQRGDTSIPATHIQKTFIAMETVIRLLDAPTSVPKLNR
jgi:hypothetical protein